MAIIFQVLFETAWASEFVDGRLPFWKLTTHEVSQFRIKDKWAGGHGPAPALLASSDEEIVEETAAAGGRVPRTHSDARFGSGVGSSARDPEQPGWAAKLTRKVKNLFCFQKDMQHK